MSAPDQIDLCVIGAGIVGLATARALLRRHPGLDLVVVEAEDRPAAHQTGNNSGVIHSGLYYRPGSLKAELCALGRESMVRFCADQAIPYDRCGKLVVATSAEELPLLDELESRGQANGLVNMERVGPAGIREHEPAVRGLEGLWIGETGIVDFAVVSQALARGLEQAGAQVRLSCAAGAIERTGNGYSVETPRGRIECRWLVNCAGVQADRVARRSGVDPGLRIVPFRGEYKLLQPAAEGLVRGLIYPVPDPRFPFLGVHFTRRIGGGVEAGPNAVLALHRNGYTGRQISPRDVLDMATFPGFWRMARRHWRSGAAEVWRSLSTGAFTRALQRLVPEISAQDLRPGGAGVRAQALDRDGSLADDFRIVTAPGAYHVLSAPSPAATASLAIGARLAEGAERALGLT